MKYYGAMVGYELNKAIIPDEIDTCRFNEKPEGR